MYTLLVKTLSGFESLLADDIRTYGGEILSVQNRSVTCRGDFKTVVELNVHSGVAMYVYVKIGEFGALSREEYLRKSQTIPFEKYLATEQTFAIKSDVYECPWIDNSMYASLLLKDAVADIQRTHAGKRSNVDIRRPDIELYQYIYKDQISIYVNSSGEPLYKRGYKTLTAKAPVNEILAHGILRLAGFTGDRTFINPFCGSGTFVSEAILMSEKKSPNLYRKHFSFSNFKGHPFHDYWKQMTYTSHGGKSVSFYGIDKDAKAIEIAKKSLLSICPKSPVQLEVCDFFSWPNPVGEAFMIMNVPYNQRFKIEPLSFFSQLGKVLKQKFSGSECWILSAGKQHTKHLGLRSSLTIPLYNGQLQVFLQQFKIY